MLSVHIKTSPLHRHVCSFSTGSQALTSSICVPGTCTTQVSPGCTGVACTTAAMRSTSVPGLHPRSCSMVVHLRGLKVQCRGPASASSCCCHLLWRVVHSSSCLQQAWYCVAVCPQNQLTNPDPSGSAVAGSALPNFALESCLQSPASRTPFCTKNSALSPQGPLSAQTTTHCRQGLLFVYLSRDALGCRLETA